MTAAKATQGQDISSGFAEFVSNFDLDNVPSDVVARAKLSILDALGIGLASANYDFGQITASALHNLAGDGNYPIIGSHLRLPLRDAAHLNGTLIHGLDFDDTHTEAVVHTSASALPTMLSAALANDASGRKALSAFIISSECASRIGAAARGGFHRKGFHPTGVVGAMGATLGAAYLYELDLGQVCHAQGIALSKAGGSLQFLDDGAWTKRNHSGWASVCALTACVMAQSGFQGPLDPYLGRYALYALHTNDGCEIQTEKLLGGLGDEWEMRHIAFKPYPACHMTHAFADAALALKSRHEISSEQIDRVIAYVHEQEVPVICEPAANKIRPQNAYDAQFSVNYVIAAAFTHDRFGLAELSSAALAHDAVLDLAARVTYVNDPDSAYPNYFSGAIDIQLHDGSVLHHREQYNRGSDKNPMSDENIVDKYFDNALRTIDKAQAERIIARVQNLENEVDLSALGEDLRASLTS